MDLFVYGTLTDPQLLTTLTEKHFASQTARLLGYERVLPQRGYAYVRQHHGHSVDGVLIRDIDRDSLHRLDRYEGEGELYLRIPVVVNILATVHPCEVYVGNPALLASDGEWKVAALQL
jgi:gamma-glutamylcyclotransferase (GGCT)/AIG2-like uncharacterized protein YtfP